MSITRAKRLSSIAAIGLLGASATILGQGKKFTTVEAKNHIGEQATVCGRVASGRYAASTRGKPTFLDLDKPYPSQLFTVLIWGENRAKFGTPEETYRDKNICVTGRIQSYQGKPEIIASDPAQLSTDSR
ncbi:MAG: DNA-binding protein [Acidobacteria bacterium]|nr:MAG: DNA-binding protein [Acidobacteriota bacterium]